MIKFLAGSAGAGSQPTAPHRYRVFELPERARRQTFTELVHVEDRAQREADRVYPMLVNFTRFRNEEERLLDGYRQELCEKHGITEARLSAIADEGLFAGWPLSAPR